MRVADRWKDYALLDASCGERLEKWGEVLLIRPDPQVLWNTGRRHPLWRRAHARYLRSSSGGGHWETLREMPRVWEIGYDTLRFRLKPMGFKHTGLFPEQAVNWDGMSREILSARRPVRVLNLFGYTGGATLACLRAGASVTHVDASKGMVAWGKENAVVSGLADRPVRWLVDDCEKFVAREIRRGSTYDAIVMDPPSYGRGPGGEIWKLESRIYAFLSECVKLLSENPLFVMVNSYTTGLSPSAMGYMLSLLLGGKVCADEIGLRVSESGLVLPCGATAVWCPA